MVFEWSHLFSARQLGRGLLRRKRSKQRTKLAASSLRLLLLVGLICLWPAPPFVCCDSLSLAEQPPDGAPPSPQAEQVGGAEEEPSEQIGRNLRLENMDDLDHVAYLSMRNFNITDEQLIQSSWLIGVGSAALGQNAHTKQHHLTSSSALHDATPNDESPKEPLALMLESFVLHLRNGHLRKLSIEELDSIVAAANLTDSLVELRIKLSSSSSTGIKSSANKSVENQVDYLQSEGDIRCQRLVTLYNFELLQRRQQSKQLAATTANDEATNQTKMVSVGAENSTLAPQFKRDEFDEGSFEQTRRLVELCKLSVGCNSADTLIELISGRWAPQASERLRHADEPERHYSRDSLSLSVAKLCPLMLFQLHADDSQCSVRRDDRPPMLAVWGFATLFVTIVSFCSLIGLSITPLLGDAAEDSSPTGSDYSAAPICLAKNCRNSAAEQAPSCAANWQSQQKRRRSPRNTRASLALFEGLAVGSLVGSALFSLIPQAFELQERESNQSFLLKAFIIFSGTYLFFCSERIMRIILDARQQHKKRRRLTHRSSNSAQVTPGAEQQQPQKAAPEATTSSSVRPKTSRNSGGGGGGCDTVGGDKAQAAAGRKPAQKEQLGEARRAECCTFPPPGQPPIRTARRQQNAEEPAAQQRKRRLASGHTATTKQTRRLKSKTSARRANKLASRLKRSSRADGDSNCESRFRQRSALSTSSSTTTSSSSSFDGPTFRARAAAQQKSCSDCGDCSSSVSLRLSAAAHQQQQLLYKHIKASGAGQQVPQLLLEASIAAASRDDSDSDIESQARAVSRQLSAELTKRKSQQQLEDRRRLVSQANILNQCDACNLHESRRDRHKQDISTVAWMIILGDGLHNFIDGISIGAALSESILSGVSISVAVICEEFPHELGDFAVLVSSGMTGRQALGYNFLSACTCYFGMAVGIILGDVTDCASYISALAAGVFLYIALVDMMGELSAALEESSRDSIARTLKLLLLQNVGIFIGISIIFVLSFMDF